MLKAHPWWIWWALGFSKLDMNYVIWFGLIVYQDSTESLANFLLCRKNVKLIDAIFFFFFFFRFMCKAAAFRLKWWRAWARWRWRWWVSEVECDWTSWMGLLCSSWVSQLYLLLSLWSCVLLDCWVLKALGVKIEIY